VTEVSVREKAPTAVVSQRPAVQDCVDVQSEGFMQLDPGDEQES
jgi:hypothetical protein